MFFQLSRLARNPAKCAIVRISRHNILHERLFCIRDYFASATILHERLFCISDYFASATILGKSNSLVIVHSRNSIPRTPIIIIEPPCCALCSFLPHLELLACTHPCTCPLLECRNQIGPLHAYLYFSCLILFFCIPQPQTAENHITAITKVDASIIWTPGKHTHRISLNCQKRLLKDQRYCQFGDSCTDSTIHSCPFSVGHFAVLG